MKYEIHSSPVIIGDNFHSTCLREAYYFTQINSTEAPTINDNEVMDIHSSFSIIGFLYNSIKRKKP
jgi:hypothetical protein